MSRTTAFVVPSSARALKADADELADVVERRDRPRSSLLATHSAFMRAISSAALTTPMTFLCGRSGMARGAEDVSTFVTGTIPGYAAHTSGQVYVNDVLEHVDDIAVQDLSLEQIKRLTVGPENTVCALSIRRGDERLHVHLVRRGAEPL